LFAINQVSVAEVADQREDFNLAKFQDRPGAREAELHNIKGEQVEKAALTRDKMLAHSTYRNQWTSSGEKKLVVDASKALQHYYDREGAQARPTIQGLTEVRRPERNTGPQKDSIGESVRGVPPRFSLLTLGPNGPRSPVLSSLMSDMQKILSTPILPRGGEAMASVMEMYSRVRGAQGDNRFDIYDWVPIFAILFVTAIVLNTVFPNSLFLTGQQLTLFGRKEGRRTEDESSLDFAMDQAIDQLENGVLMLSAIRDGGGCAARLACKLGEMGRQASDGQDLLLEAVNFLVPNKYSNFTVDFEKVMRQGDQESCSAECRRCLVI